MKSKDHKKSNPFVSIIILNYNQIEVTLEFLESCKKLIYKNYEIILIDNASNEDPEFIIKKRFPDVIYIRNETNLGFTGGNNVGIKAGKGDYFFIVNNDTEVTENLLDELINPFLANAKIGMVSPKIMYFEKPNVIQYAGYTKVNPYTGRNKTIGMFEIDHKQFDKPGYTNYAHGAAMLVKKDVIERVGMFCDIFFIYYEELDWSSRTTREGFDIYFQPSAKIYHKESITMGKESAIKAYFHNRNRVLFMKRNTSTLQFFIFSLFFLVIISPTKIFKYIKNGQREHLKNFFKALFWNIKYINKKFN